jgi:hypothetical protein
MIVEGLTSDGGGPTKIGLAAAEYGRRMTHTQRRLEDLRGVASEAGVAALSDGRPGMAGLLVAFSEYLAMSGDELEGLMERLQGQCRVALEAGLESAWTR